MKKYSKYGSIKKFFHEYDLFKSPANLRFDQQPDVSQLCSGIFSFLLIGFFAYVLINQFLKVLNYQSIEYDETIEVFKNLTEPTATNIRFSITPAWRSYETWKSLFQITVFFVSKETYFADPKLTKIEMQKCKQENWANYSQIYSDLQFYQNLCLKNPESVTVLGSNFMDRMDSLYIQMTRCNPNTTASCITNETQFQQQLKLLYEDQANYMNFYIVDTSINADKENAVQEYVRMNYDFMYTSQTRLSFFLYLGMYIVETDNSLWTLSDGAEEVAGYYIADMRLDEVDRVVEKDVKGTDAYGDITIVMTNKRRRFSRTRGKIDTVVAYAGGLFGILTGIFAYFINSYNQYSYELRVAESSFNYDEHGNQVKQKHFNFLKYIKFTIYDWVKFLFCYEIPWDYDTKKDQTRQEANATMDVMHLFRKIQLIQLVLGYMIDKNQLILHNLTKPPTLKQVQNQRLCMAYYYAVIRGKFAINVEDIKNNNNSLTQYRKIQSKNSLRSINSLVEEKQQNKRENQQIGTSTQLNKLTTSVTYNEFGEVVKPEENDLIKEKKLIKEKFLMYSRIMNKKIIDGIAEFPEIAIQARELKLYPEMQKIEEELAQIFYGLSPDIRDKVIDRIPLKILHRLVNSIQKKHKQDFKKAEKGEILPTQPQPQKEKSESLQNEQEKEKKHYFKKTDSL